jgi:cyclophilin family peptidyl-prolyl cis-trans isomerase
MKSDSPNTNSCNFSIGLLEHPQKMAKSVVFGIVDDGQNILDMINKIQISHQYPELLTITDCGLLLMP